MAPEDFAMTAPDKSGDLVVIRGRTHSRTGEYLVDVDVGGHLDGKDLRVRRTLSLDAFRAILRAAVRAGISPESDVKEHVEVRLNERTVQVFDRRGDSLVLSDPPTSHAFEAPLVGECCRRCGKPRNEH